MSGPCCSSGKKISFKISLCCSRVEVSPVDSAKIWWMWCASDFLLVRLLLSISISISILADGLMHFKKNTTCSNDLPMLALEFTKGATKSEASTRTSKIPPRPRRNLYVNHCASTYAIISLSWRDFFLICIVPVKTFHCLLHLFALFTKFRIRSWFLLLDYQSFLGKPKSRKIDSRFTRGLPRLECPPGVRWGKMKSS